MDIKVASLFSGIGGFEKGILQANPKAQIVFSSEIDKYARQIYKKNFGVEPHGDITQIEASNIPDHDILCGGFPCQAFSIAGLRRGFEDTRGSLFFEIMRIVEAKRPKLLFLENVRGLLSHDEGRTFHTILRSMDDLGYDAEWQVFNSKNHGVPQNRERVFIIGHLRGGGTEPIFPIKGICEQYNFMATKGNRHRNRTWGGTLRKEGTSSFGSGDVFIVDEKRIRRLTPTECEKLQGFPIGWTAQGIDENGNIVNISDTQRYKCLGNAVTVNVIEFIARHIFSMLDEVDK